MEIDKTRKISDLTVEEFQSLFNINPNQEYEYGLKGLAKILSCSRSKASQVKSSGILDDAISQNGGHIMIDKKLALELYHQHSSKRKKK